MWREIILSNSDKTYRTYKVAFCLEIHRDRTSFKQQTFGTICHHKNYKCYSNFAFAWIGRGCGSANDLNI